MQMVGSLYGVRAASCDFREDVRRQGQPERKICTVLICTHPSDEMVCINVKLRHESLCPTGLMNQSCWQTHVKNELLH